MSAARTWKCPQCGLSLEIGYDWLAEHGGPVCEHCDCDMDLQPAGADNEKLTAELLEIGKELLDWADTMGGWEAKCWTRLRTAMNKAAGAQASRRTAGDCRFRRADRATGGQGGRRRTGAGRPGRNRP